MTDVSDSQLLEHAGNVRGKVTIITGAASGIGREAALLFAKHGAKIVIGDIDISGAQGVVKEIEELGGSAVSQRCDVTNWDDQIALFELARKEYGSVDIVVANAGVGEIGRLTEHRFEGGKLRPPKLKTIEVNVNSVLYTTHIALHYLKLDEDHSKSNNLKAIVLIGSMASWQALGTSVVYSTAKHAVLGLMRALGPVCSARGIRIGSVHPWFADTQILDTTARIFLAGIPKTPLHRIAATILCIAAHPDPATSEKPWLLPDSGNVLRVDNAEILDGVYSVVNQRVRGLFWTVQGIRYYARTSKDLYQALGPKVVASLFLVAIFGLWTTWRVVRGALVC